MGLGPVARGVTGGDGATRCCSSWKPKGRGTKGACMKQHKSGVKSGISLCAEMGCLSGFGAQGNWVVSQTEEAGGCSGSDLGLGPFVSYFLLTGGVGWARALYLRCAKKCGQDQSVLCAACCLLTSLCDTVGAILARQLTIQVFTGAYLAAVDFLNFMFALFPVCGPKPKSMSGWHIQERRKRRRRRQLRASVFALALPLILGPGWAIWAAVSKPSPLVQGPQRRLLGSLLQENPEVLGYLLGGIAAFGSWASRIPSFFKICRGKSFSCIHLWTLFLSALAGLLYASAIVAHDQQPEYLLRATPWFLTSLGRAALDLAIIFLSCVMKSRMRQAFGFATEARESSDTQALLTCAEKEEKQEAGTSDKVTPTGKLLVSPICLLDGWTQAGSAEDWEFCKFLYAWFVKTRSEHDSECNGTLHFLSSKNFF